MLRRLMRPLLAKRSRFAPVERSLPSVPLFLEPLARISPDSVKQSLDDYELDFDLAEIDTYLLLASPIQPASCPPDDVAPPSPAAFSSWGSSSSTSGDPDVTCAVSLSRQQRSPKAGDANAKACCWEAVDEDEPFLLIPSVIIAQVAAAQAGASSASPAPSASGRRLRHWDSAKEMCSSVGAKAAASSSCQQERQQGQLGYKERAAPKSASPAGAAGKGGQAPLGSGSKRVLLMGQRWSLTRSTGRASAAAAAAPSSTTVSSRTGCSRGSSRSSGWKL